MVRRRPIVFAAALGWRAVAAEPNSPSTQPVPLRFGVLPIGGAVESRDKWAPLLNDMSRALGRPVTALSVTSYESLEKAIQRNEVDLALLSAKMALDAVSRQRMNVLAQVKRHAGEADHRAVLLVRKTGPLDNLEALLARPEQWRLARGDSRSVSGFILPQVQLFLPHRIEMETRFRGEIIGTHQVTALAVANGDADVATNNTTDFERFRQQFPDEADRLQVIWRSAPTPPAQIVVRQGVAPAAQKKAQAFLVRYGQGTGSRADSEREALKSLGAAFGYVAANNDALLPAAHLEYQLARQSALNARWVNEAAREARLQRVESQYAELIVALRNSAR